MNVSIEKIISFAKRRGFIFQGSDIYGGLAGTWDYGPLGALLKENIKRSWIDFFIRSRSDRMVLIDSAVLMNARVWDASGHIKEFSDPLVDCKNCKSRFRADHLNGSEACPICGKKELTDARPFNMLFRTWIGPVQEHAAEIYLRPENAQGVFVNFKNVLDTMHMKLPFGIASIGRVFRNEISPAEFIFRSREFELMEFEYFVLEKEWKEAFDMWLEEIKKWSERIGIPARKLHFVEISSEERAHYSGRTVDIEYEYPFGTKEVMAIAYRQDYDLKNHMDKSGIDLRYTDDSGEKFLPHVVEPTFGIDRVLLALLCESYREEKLEGGDERTVLSLAPYLAPFSAAVFPLVANKENIVSKAKNVYLSLKDRFSVAWDDIGNIGKRYRRQDEVGTPWCVTVDYQTLEDDTVTVRDRETMKQERVNSNELKNYFSEKL